MEGREGVREREGGCNEPTLIQFYEQKELIRLQTVVVLSVDITHPHGIAAVVVEVHSFG